MLSLAAIDAAQHQGCPLPGRLKHLLPILTHTIEEW
jgi:hypothetical protein